MAGRRRVGYTVRKLRSGRWQLLVPDRSSAEAIAAARKIGMGSYASRKAAEQEGVRLAAEQAAGRWVDPRRGERPLVEWLDDWLAKARVKRHGERHAAESARVADQHIVPWLGSVELVDLTTARVRAWYDDLTAAEISRRGTAGLVPAKAYRLLRAALEDAVRDELIVRNPCNLRGAGVERSPERPLLPDDQVVALVAAVPDRWYAMVVTVATCALRFGELAALQRRHVNPLQREITLEQAVSQVPGRGAVVKAPKSDAGRRTVAMPDALVPVLVDHLDRYVRPEPEALMFTGDRGGRLNAGNWSKVWRRARDEVGVPDGVGLHDLRHYAGTVAAQTGATTRELQRRLGHASPDAAHRYQHAAEERDRAIADGLDLRLPRFGRRTAGAHVARIAQLPDEEIGSEQQ